jgi:hypothetical protein
MVEGFLIVRNHVTSCLYMSGGSARESNPPTPLVTKHNGFEVRSYSYQGVRLAPPTWQIKCVVILLRKLWRSCAYPNPIRVSAKVHYFQFDPNLQPGRQRRVAVLEDLYVGPKREIIV